MIPRHVLESIPRRADSRILSSLRVDDVVINAVSGGLSRNGVFCGTVGSDASLIQYAIRSWESATYDSERICKILDFQAYLVGKQIAAPKPICWLSNERLIPYEQSFWTIESWLAGKSLVGGADVSDSLLSEIVGCLVDLHTAGRNFGTIHPTSPGITERIRNISDWKERAMVATSEKWISKMSRFGPLPNVSTEQLSRIEKGFGLALQVIQYLGSSWVHQLNMFLDRKPRCHWIIRDLWRSNILIDQDRITGVVDFGASRTDWPILELVRCLSSFLQPDDSRWQASLDGYYEQLQTRNAAVGAEAFDCDWKVDLEGIRTLDHVATTLSLLYWYDWLTSEDFESINRPKPAIWTRVEELAARLSRFHSCNLYHFLHKKHPL